jgi:hypothetical protein
MQDVYSFGIVLWELLSLQVPWEGVANLWQVHKGKVEEERGEGCGGQVLQGLSCYRVTNAGIIICRNAASLV